MGKSLMLTGLIAGAAALSGRAAGIRELPAEIRQTEPQGADYAFCRKLVIAFLKNDAKTFLAQVPEEARQKFNEKQFSASRKSIIESMGEPVSFQYVTALEMTAFTPHVWKIRFQRTDPRNGRKFTAWFGQGGLKAALPQKWCGISTYWKPASSRYPLNPDQFQSSGIWRTAPRAALVAMAP